MEQERHNLPWRWNQWSNLFTNAVNYQQLHDQVLQDEAGQLVGGGGAEEQASKPVFGGPEGAEIGSSNQRSSKPMTHQKSKQRQLKL
jgi:hypothetical protein